MFTIYTFSSTLHVGPVALCREYNKSLCAKIQHACIGIDTRTRISI